MAHQVKPGPERLVAIEDAVLLFDFDGVIIDSEAASLTAWREVFRLRGADLTLKRWLPFVGRATGRSPTDLLEEITGRLQPDAQARKDELHRSLVSDLPCRPGIAECVRALSRLRVQLHVLSNSDDAYLEEHLRRLDLSACFTTVTSGNRGGRRMEKSELYGWASTTFGLKHRPALVIEDSEHGVLAAQKSGLSVLAFPNEVTQHQRLDRICPAIPYPAPLEIARIRTALAGG